jgi:hypothetical protein
VKYQNILYGRYEIPEDKNLLGWQEQLVVLLPRYDGCPQSMEYDDLMSATQE